MRQAHLPAEVYWEETQQGGDGFVGKSDAEGSAFDGGGMSRKVSGKVALNQALKVGSSER